MGDGMEGTWFNYSMAHYLDAMPCTLFMPFQVGAEFTIASKLKEDVSHMAVLEQK